MKIRGRACWSLVVMVVLCLVGSQPFAAENKPFADTRIVLQLSDAGAERQARVLNVASNLMRHYGPDAVDIEIVVFGAAMPMLFAGGENAGRIADLALSGVRFAACGNTMETLKRKTGREPELVDQAYRVQTGVAHIVRLVREGYTLVKP